MLKRIINGIFVGGILLVLAAGLWRTYFRPRDIMEYENRYANKVAPASVAGYLSGDFQNRMDLALADQVQFATTYKRIFNGVSSGYLKNLVVPIAARSEDRYIDVMGRMLFGSHITYRCRTLEEVSGLLDGKAANYNAAFARHPELDFYLYFIEKDTDLNFETGEHMGLYEYLRDRLDLPPDRMARFAIPDFASFDRLFFETDTHWNLYGSYKGYREAAALLGVTEPLLEPAEEVTVGPFSGIKAAGTGASAFKETFTAYRFDYPPLSITINGAPAADYGAQSAYLAGEGPDVLTYGNFYGGDFGEVILDTGRTDGENILLLGESYDNAILKLLASHFGKTCSVDLRYYSHYMGQAFDLGRYTADHGIDKVLLIGNLDYFLMSEFDLEG